MVTDILQLHTHIYDSFETNQLTNLCVYGQGDSFSKLSIQTQPSIPPYIYLCLIWPQMNWLLCQDINCSSHYQIKGRIARVPNKGVRPADL